MDEEMTSNSVVNPEQTPSIVDTVDGITRARVASLTARGIANYQIASILMLTVEQVAACENTEEYKKKFAEEADAAIQQQVDLEDGWNALEEAALAAIMEQLKFNRDPKYLLSVAAVANKAERRVRQNKGDPKVIDNSGGTTTNIIKLTLNKVYVNQAQQPERTAIDVTPKPAEFPHRQSDLPSPKLVAELLEPVKEQKKKPLTEFEQLFKDAGVVFDDEGGAK